MPSLPSDRYPKQNIVRMIGHDLQPGASNVALSWYLHARSTNVASAWIQWHDAPPGPGAIPQMIYGPILAPDGVLSLSDGWWATTAGGGMYASATEGTYTDISTVDAGFLIDWEAQIEVAP